MAFDKAIYDKALTIISERKKNAEDERKKRHDICITRFPKIAQCEREMRNTAFEAAKALGMGENADSFIKNLSEKNLQAQNEIRDILEKADLPSDYLKIKYTCEKCKDSGFVDGKMCSCFRQLIRSISYSRMCDKFPVASSTFNSFKLDFYPDSDDENGINARKRMEQIFTFCKNYAEDFSTKSQSLFFFGETGLGKTHLSLAIAGAVINKGYGVIYGSAQNLLNTLENEKFGRSSSYGGERELLECDLLIIDDLGVEFSTQFTVSAIYNIINSRLMSERPVIISTNLTLSEIEEKYSRRIASRIMGSYNVLQFRGRDIRPIK